MSLVTPQCPVGCGTMLPIVNFDLCDPTISFGEIERIVIGSGDADCFTDWTDLAEWTARIDNDSLVDTTPSILREFHVIADLPAAAADEVIISMGRKVYSPATHTIAVDIDDLTAENYEFARLTSCNTQYKIWFFTKSFMYGGDCGILANVNLRPVIERGQKSINKLSGTISWEAQFSPERAESVFAV
jgi:hypothetical protein